jgi:hypothetical protein
MIYYIFKEQIFTVFLSLTHLTAMTFPDRIHDYVGGQEQDFKIYELNKKRSLVFEPKRTAVDRNFIVFGKNIKHHFNIKYDEKLSNKDIEIRTASSCSLYTLIKETTHYQLFECPKSLLIVNKKRSKLKVNEAFVDKKKFISKGPPVWIDSKLRFYRGRAL